MRMKEGHCSTPPVAETVGEMKRRKLEPMILLMGVVGTIFLLFVAYPLLLLFLQSFKDDKGLAIDSYVRIFTERQNLLAFGNSLYVSATVTFCSVLIGTGLAWLITRTDVPFKGGFRILIFLTFVTPPYIGTIGWIQLFGKAGYINNLLARLSFPSVQLYSLKGIVAVMVNYLYPLVFWAAANAFERTDLILEDAAASLGATRWRTFTTITLPLASPSILSAAVLVFIHTVSCFSVAAALGLPTRHYVLATRIYAALSHYDVQMACALSVVLLVFSGGAFFAERMFLGQKKYIAITSSVKRAASITLGRWRLPVAILLVIYGLFTAILPLLAIFITSLLKVWGLSPTLENFSLKNYSGLFKDKLIVSALCNSLIFASLAASAAVFLGIVVAYVAVRTKYVGRDFLGLLATFPLAIPAPVLATAIILAFMKPPLTLYNTPAIIFVAYLVAFAPFALRNLSGSLQAIDPELEEAAWLSGATRSRSLRDILLPLLKRELFTSWMLVFLMSFREIPLSLMLHTQGTETVGIVLFSLRGTVGVETVSALAMIVMLITTSGYLAVRKFGKMLEAT